MILKLSSNKLGGLNPDGGEDTSELNLPWELRFPKSPGAEALGPPITSLNN